MISVIIPFYNEKKNLPVLLDKLTREFKRLKKTYEIVLVDDGSNDDGGRNLKEKAEIRVIKHRKRFGKGQALKTGLDAALGDTIVFMDADLQNDPRDLEAMLSKIEKGYDMVNGIRTPRHSENMILGAYSFFAEKLLKTFLDSPYSDINCGFKVFRRSVLDEFIFYGNNFRFFPLGVFYSGYKVTELPVVNNPRLHGKSKFGPGKLMVGIFDTLTAFFIYKFSERPLHFFGPIGGLIFFAGFTVSLYLTVERLFFQVRLSDRPLLWLGVLLIIVGIQVGMTGIIGELVVYLNKKKN
jgi:glycosyltransferase involved in cell wall biosynthesis